VGAIPTVSTDTDSSEEARIRSLGLSVRRRGFPTDGTRLGCNNDAPARHAHACGAAAALRNIGRRSGCAWAIRRCISSIRSRDISNLRTPQRAERGAGPRRPWPAPPGPVIGASVRSERTGAMPMLRRRLGAATPPGRPGGVTSGPWGAWHTRRRLSRRGGVDPAEGR
jgi:hypothetical protein